VPTPDLSNDALDFVRKMQPKHAKQVLLKILELCRNPDPPDSKLLHGSAEGYRRADSGEYRIIYQVEGDSLRIYLIGKRNDDEVYRRLSRK
jgi:mRNA interferase RelE/StbE